MTSEEKHALANMSQMMLLTVRQCVDAVHDDILDQRGSCFEEDRYHEASLHILRAVEALGQAARYLNQQKRIEAQQETLTQQLQKSLHIVREKTAHAGGPQ